MMQKNHGKHLTGRILVVKRSVGTRVTLSVTRRVIVPGQLAPDFPTQTAGPTIAFKEDPEATRDSLRPASVLHAVVDVFVRGRYWQLPDRLRASVAHVRRGACGVTVAGQKCFTL